MREERKLRCKPQLLKINQAQLQRDVVREAMNTSFAFRLYIFKEFDRGLMLPKKRTFTHITRKVLHSFAPASGASPPEEPPAAAAARACTGRRGCCEGSPA